MGAVVRFHDDGRRLRILAAKERAIAFSSHARQEMRNGGIDANDILSSLRRCSVASVELHGLEWRWTASGRDCDGKQIEMVVVADEVAERIEGPILKPTNGLRKRTITFWSGSDLGEMTDIMETIGMSVVAESPKNEQSSKITGPPEASDYLSYSGVHIHQHWQRPYWRLLPLLDAVADARIARARRRAKKAARRVPVQTVLLTAVEVPSREADLAHVIRRICSTTRHNISVATARMEPVGKFDNVNRAIFGYNLKDYNWLLIVDDDIEVQADFLDLLIYFSITNRFKLAQPAHKYYSYASFKITQRHWGSQARRTGFVEIGPVSLLHTDTFAHLIPFPSLRWSWGLDVFWAQVAKRQGWRIGVIDAAPIRHLRPVGSSYDTVAAKNEAIAFLSSQAVTISKAEMFDVNERIA